MRHVVLLATVITLAMAGTVLAAPVQLVEVSGVLQLQRTGTGSWDACSSGVAVSPGDCLRTAEGGAACLVYADGTRLKIKGSTEIQLLASGYRLRYGATWVRVVKQGSRFVTMTPNAVVSVRGTVYSVTADRGAARLGQGLTDAMRSGSFLRSLPRAHVAGGSVLLGLLDRATCVSSVRVYRGVVGVAPLSPAGGEGDAEMLVTAGHAMDVTGAATSASRLLDVDDYKEWGIGFRRLFMDESGSAAPPDAVTPRDDAGRQGYVGSDGGDDGARVRLLDEAADR